ncbi:hypothetical protein D6T70_14285 [Kurthia gibsonii]|uniref:hypothetical protein n=1 Tax=Kurthia gibsonii TaxID=33946 RepID=UPI000EB5B355|nr:hypothetical protein [Kurthia gibsonii]RXH50916.1 hypothetical protein D6T70_14285 [Kurthia gibsonii]
MSNFKLVKTAAALALGASVVTSAVATTDASAASKYKIKSGKLVYAKSGKVVKGYVTYKSTVYKNGSKLTGLKGKTYYKAGKKATGTYKGAYYVKGVKKVTTGTYNKAYYVKGVKKVSTGLYASKYYKDGKLATGTYKGAYYVKGLKKVTTGTYNGAYYVAGKKVVSTGLYKDQLYVSGKLNKGYKLYKEDLYKDAVLNKGLVVFEDKLYDGAKQNDKLVIFDGKLYDGVKVNEGIKKFEDKWYNNAELADGTFTIDGKEVAFENGVEVGAKVKSVEAINAKEIKVTFNKTVKAETVETTDFTVTKNNGTAVAFATGDDVISVAKDGRSAVITLASGLQNNDNVEVKVKKDEILTSAYDKFEGATFSDIKFADTQAPKLLSSKATDGTTVELTFDEPIDWETNTGGISVNGATLVAGANTKTAGNYTYTFAVAQLKSGANTVQVLNYADFAGNKEALTTVSVDYVADTAVPEVKTITAEDSNTFIVELNKSVSTIANTNFTVKKGNYTFTSADLGVKFVDAKGVETATNGTTPSKYVKVTVPTQENGINPLYAVNENSVNLSVAISGYKDGTVLGKEFTGSVTLSKDLTAPKVVSSKLITFDKTAKKITVPFDKTLTLGDASKLTVVSGTVKVAATPSVVGKNLVITIDDAAGLTDGNYSLVLDKGLVKDGSNNVNEATTLNTTVSEKVGITTKTGAIFGTESVSEAGKNVITVNYAVKVDDAAALASSYSLNGSALPEGTVVYFTSLAKTEVKIELPASYKVGLNDLNAKIALNANAVKEYATGNVISSNADELKAVEQVIKLKDNVAPTITKVEYIKDTATGLATGLKVTFSENIKDTTVLNTFVIKQGTTDVAFEVADAAGTDATDDNVVTLNFTDGLKLAASNVVLSTTKAENGITLTDISGNNKLAAISGINAQ